MTQTLLDFTGIAPRPRPNPVKAEIDRLSQNAQRVLELLQDGQWHRNIELVHVGGIRAIGRVFELKRLGHAIEKRHVHGGNWEYRLVKQNR